MARALLEAGIKPDRVLGTSIGTINGAAIAAEPSPAGPRALVETWAQLGSDAVARGQGGGSTRSMRSPTRAGGIGRWATNRR
jgi:predicted acylesterase/phospholipase RssA